MASPFRAGRRSVALGAILLAASTATVLATANTPPHFTSLTVSPSVLNEGQSVVLNGAFTDPDTTDAHSMLVYWDGGDSNFKQKVQLPPGQLSFQVHHTYTDNVASPTIKVVLIDRQHPIDANDNTDGIGGGETKFVPIQVKNVAPRFVDSSIVGSANAGGVVVEGDFTDPGADAIQLTAKIGLPINPAGQIPMACTLGKGERHFRCEYSQQASFAAKTYNINLLVKDDDGGQDTHTMSVHFGGITRP